MSYDPNQKYTRMQIDACITFNLFLLHVCHFLLWLFSTSNSSWGFLTLVFQFNTTTVYIWYKLFKIIQIHRYQPYIYYLLLLQCSFKNDVLAQLQNNYFLFSMGFCKKCSHLYFSVSSCINKHLDVPQCCLLTFTSSELTFHGLQLIQHRPLLGKILIMQLNKVFKGFRLTYNSLDGASRS